MSEERCECCDLPVVSCGKAAEARARVERKQEERRLEKRGAFRSQYTGLCASCRTPFPAGTFIRMNADDGLLYDGECCL